MNSPTRSCGCEGPFVQQLQRIQSSFLTVMAIVLVAASVNAQDTATFHDETSSRPLIPARVYVDKANTLGRARLWQQAVELYLEALQLDASMADAHNNLGHAFVQMGRLEDAVGSLRLAVKLQPENPLFRYNLGNTYLLNNNVAQAIEQLKKAVELRHDYPEAHNDLGNAYLDAGDYKNALTSFARTIEQSPNFAPAYNSLGQAYYRLRRFAEAKIQFIKGLALTPDSFQLQYNLGAASLVLSDYANAVRCFQAALRLAPDNARAVYNLGIAYLGLKDRSAALTQHSRLRTLDSYLATELYKAIHGEPVLFIDSEQSKK